MADLDSSSQLAKEALDELRQAGTLSAKTLDKLNAAIKANTKEIDKNTDELADEAKAREKLTKDLIGLARNIGTAAQAVRENREDFRSLGPAVDATASALKMSLGGVSKGMDSLGSILSGVGAVLPGWGKLVGVFGAGVSAAGKAVSKFGAEAVDAAAQYAKFSLEEVQRVVTGFRTIAEVGGLTGDSFRGLMKDSQALGLSVDTYSKLIARNSEGLATVAGSVTGGARVLKAITTAGTEFEDQFLKLGYGFEQQSEFSARFLAQQRNISKINLDDTKALSEANRNYMMVVDELARLTGKSREKIANEMEAATRQLRFGATLQLANAYNTKDAIFTASQIIETIGSKELSEGFKDIFGGVSTQRAIELQVATGGAAKQLADDLKYGRITLDQFMTKFKESIRETGYALGGPDGIAGVEERLGGLGTVLDPVLVGLRRVANATDTSANVLKEVNKEQDEAAKATGKEVDNIVKAQKHLRDFAVSLDKIVSDKLFPTMATSIQYFTSVISDGADKIAKILGVTGNKGGGAATGIPGAPSNNPAGAGGRGPGVQQAPPTGIGGAGAPTPEAAGTLGAIRNMIGRAESGGDYNIMVGGKKGDLTNMTIAQIFEQQKKMLQRGSGFESSALGKYQITYGTLQDLIRKTGMDINTTKFDQATQDKLADELIVSRGGYNKYAAGAINKERFMRNLSSIWAGLPMDASGRSFYQGVGSNKATIGFEEAMGSFAYGGISAGPRSGYLSMLHGTEAVIPLPGGRSVPVEMTGMSDRMGEQVSILTTQVDRFDQMISLLQSSVDMQGKIYRATVN